MAAPAGTVRVSGLPADIEEGRLKDKLFIHFLRTRNGGGEIETITIAKATPVSALITFEECEVARSVIERSPHVLEVSGKKYKLSVSEYREVLDPDEVVTRLSAVMDYSRVPGGALALRRLQENHREIHLSYDAALELYTLYGAYSKVQAALTQLFGQSGNQESDSGQRVASGSWSEPSSQRLQVTPSEDLTANLNRQKEESRSVDPLGSPAEVSSSRSQRDLTPGAHDDQGEGAAPQLTWPPEEDSLVIVDADMFQYLQKYRQNDYQQILRLYGVEAVEVTNQGLTSLYLQSAAGAGEKFGDRKTLSLARNAIRQFFQENETKIWRVEFLKSIFSSGKVLQTAKDSLSLRYPLILLKEDDTYVYMIGDSRDVCDAKQCFLEQSLDQCLKSEEDETKDDAVRKCRLAPRFKESGLPPLGGKPTDFCLRGGPAAQSRAKTSGPMLGFNVLSEPAQTGERVPGGSPQTTAEDIWLKSHRSLSPTAFTQSNDTFLNSELMKSPPKAASLSPSLLDSVPAPAVPGSTLKRANSFSGTPQRKAQPTQQRSRDDANKPAAGAGSGSGSRVGTSSSSPADHLSKDRQVGHHAEIQVSTVMWQHIKEAYSTQVDDLTSDILTLESPHGGGGGVTVTLRGASPSKLKSCRLSLQKLIDSVNRDFSVQDLPLSELGLTDPTDETLLACCHNLRNCFRTVTVQITKKNVLLLGPTLLSSQLAASLLSVFSKDLAGMNKPAPLIQTTQGQSAGAMSESGSGTPGGTSIDQETRTKQSGSGETKPANGPVSQPRLYKDPVIKEKVKYTAAADRNGQKSSVFVSKMGGSERESEDKSGTHPEDEPSQPRLEASQKGGEQQRRHEREESRSGAEAEPLRWGIHGRMTFSKLNISIQGHKNSSTIKITYYIPDGIQQEGHPSPGKPFQGGTFDAYLPDCEAARRLMPRLEKAFQLGLSFTVMEKGTGARVTWSCIPHKTTLQGGKSGWVKPLGTSSELDRGRSGS
ncbi:unnamed protein product [Tetraodon nigroviridis]|uniref:Chromosome 3 SCAF7269, whole genome shotgun sequence n=1 Tax=Tetraodon nigroviridis TaxID=99883 RepID=Q4TAQ2_TETNG|nr:unnamed protein product [Tetraodon nigroviridis]